MRKVLKRVLIIISYFIVAIVFFIIGGHYYNDIYNIINKKSKNQIDIIGKQYSLISNGHNNFFPTVNFGEKIIFKFIDHSNINFMVEKDGIIITNCSASYYKNNENIYYYSFNECNIGSLSGDSDKLTISIKDGYFCIMSDDCLENERFILQD